MGNCGPASLANEGTCSLVSFLRCLWRRRLNDFWDPSLNVKTLGLLLVEDEDRLLASEMAHGSQAQGPACHIVVDAKKLAWRSPPRKGCCCFDGSSLTPRHKTSQIVLVASQRGYLPLLRQDKPVSTLTSCNLSLVCVSSVVSQKVPLDLRLFLVVEWDSVRLDPPDDLLTRKSKARTPCLARTLGEYKCCTLVGSA